MKVNGKMINLMEEEDSFMLMVTFMKVNGSMIKHKEEASMNIMMVLNTWVIGKMIDSMVMVLRLGLIMLDMKEIMIKVRNTELELLNGLMGPFILVSSLIIISMGKVYTPGGIKENTKRCR